MTQHILFISGGEIVLVMLLALLFFGSKAIPDIAKTLGKGLREFKKATNEIKREINDNTGDFKKDIDDIKSTVKDETSKITSDIENVSSSVKEETTKLSQDISEGLNNDNDYPYPPDDYDAGENIGKTEDSITENTKSEDKTQ